MAESVLRQAASQVELARALVDEINAMRLTAVADELAAIQREIAEKAPVQLTIEGWTR